MVVYGLGMVQAGAYHVTNNDHNRAKCLDMAY